METTPKSSGCLKAGFLILLGLYLISGWILVWLFTRENRIAHAVISMGSGLILLWVILCGSCMYVFREKIKSGIQKFPLNWQVKFVGLGIFMAMIEEAITTSMTNLAPLFGVKTGEAYITASTNYFDVIFHHSVIVFIPWFIAWAWILKRYDFSPFWVFLIFGINGLFAETLSFGLQNLNQFAMWIFVYGLMVYLPACTVPDGRDVLPPKIWQGALAFVLPLFVSIPWAIVINLIYPDHPAIHFPPIQI
jgi:hypothetical protein